MLYAWLYYQVVTAETKPNKLLKDNDELIASFSRALASDLRASQSQEEFDKALGDAVDSIYDASVNKTKVRRKAFRS